MKIALKFFLEKVGLLGLAKKSSYVINNMLHILREMVYRAPNLAVIIRQYIFPPSDEMMKAIKEFKREGIVVLENFLSNKRLEEIRRDFENFVKAAEAAPPGPVKLTPDGGSLHVQVFYPEQGYDIESLATFTNDPFKHCQSFLELALDEFILGVITGYMGKRFMLQQSTASRYYPCNKTNFGSWQWHHDSWGRKINVMILFTDVTEKDQYMSYVKQSHKIYHNLERTSVNDRFTEKEVTDMCGYQVFKCLGKAGTVFIFDANGFHRGNRSLGAVRDTLINQYTAGRYLWSFDIPSGFTRNLTATQLDFLKQNKNIKIVN